MNKKNSFIISLSLLFICSTNLFANEENANRWGYGAIGCGAVTVVSAGGCVYNLLQWRKNRALLLRRDKKLSPKQFEQVLRKINRSKKLAILFGFTTVLGGAGTGICLYKRHQEKNNSSNGGGAKPEHKPPHKPKFLESKDCGICFAEGKVVVLQCGCGTYYCQGCLKHQLTTFLKDPNADGVTLNCPNMDCKQELDQLDVGDILDGDNERKELLDEYMGIKLKEWFLNNASKKNKRHCPTPNCKYFFEFEGTGNMRADRCCPECKKRYCVNCLDNHAPGTRCQKESDTDEWVKKNTKPCKFCFAPIEKISGCDHVWCAVSGCVGRRGFCLKCYHPTHHFCSNNNVPYPPGFPEDKKS